VEKNQVRSQGGDLSGHAVVQSSAWRAGMCWHSDQSVKIKTRVPPDEVA